jgi:hypothetical protein
MPGSSLLKRPEKLASLAVETLDDAANEAGKKSGGKKSGGQKSGGQRSGGPMRSSGSSGRRSARAKKQSPYAADFAGPSSSGLSGQLAGASLDSAGAVSARTRSRMRLQQGGKSTARGSTSSVLEQWKVRQQQSESTFTTDGPSVVLKHWKEKGFSAPPRGKSILDQWR